MYEIISTINSRELATYIWIGILLLISLSVPSIRKQVPDLLKALFDRKIVIPILGMVLYVGILVFTLHAVGFWNTSLLKNTVIWLIGVGFIMFLNVSTASKKEGYLKNTLKENIRLIIIVEFVINFWVLPLPIELLLIPITTILMLMQVVSEREPKHKKVKVFVNNILTVMGLGICAFTVFKLFSDFNSFVSFASIQSFVFPIIMTLAYIPFLYLLALWIVYEDLFVRMNLAFDRDTKRVVYAKRKVFKASFLNLNKIRKLSKGLKIYMLNSEKEIGEQIQSILKSKN